SGSSVPRVTRSAMSPTWTSSQRVRATAAAAGLISTPVTRHPLRLSATANDPVAHPTSSTNAPSGTCSRRAAHDVPAGGSIASGQSYGSVLGGVIEGWHSHYQQ